jgi:hypothetical protein
LWHWRVPLVASNQCHKRIWVHYLAAAAGAAIPIVPVLIHNQVAFGAFWRTAYALTHEQTGFAWEYFQEHFVNYLHQICGDGAGLFLALGVVGMVLMCGDRRARPTGVLLALVTVPTTLLYMCYYWAPGTMSTATMRFVLPTFVCYIVAGLWCLSQATAQSSAVLRVLVVLAVVFVQGVWGAYSSFQEGRTLHYQKDVLAKVTDALDQNTQYGDVVMAPQQLLQHLDFVRHWRLADPPTGAGGFMDRFRDRQGDSDAPSPRQQERARIQAEKYSGLTPAQREKKIAEDIHSWADGHKVYYVGGERDIEDMGDDFFYAKSFKIIAKVPLPEAPPAQNQGGFGFMGGGRRFGPGGDANRPGGAPGPGADARPPADGGPGGFFRPPDGGPGGFRFGGGRRGRGMGGMFGRGFLMGEKEAVIAEWTYSPPPAPEKKKK